MYIHIFVSEIEIGYTSQVWWSPFFQAVDVACCTVHEVASSCLGKQPKQCIAAYAECNWNFAENVIKPGAQQAADKLDETAQQVRDELPKKADEASGKIKQQTKQAADQVRDTANNPPDLQGKAKQATDKLAQ